MVGIGLEQDGCHIGGGWVLYICLIGCRLPPLDGYLAVFLVLTIEVYEIGNKIVGALNSVTIFDIILSLCQKILKVLSNF